MKKEVILVPKNKCPLDVIAEMGEQTKSAWIFLHCTAVKKLVSIADDHRIRRNSDIQEFFWNATATSPKTSIRIQFHPCKVWLEVYLIDADDIAFKMPSCDPENIIFMKMDD